MTTISPTHHDNHIVVEHTRSPQRFDIIVIGGGQAGLATGYYLARRGLSFVILDSYPQVGDAWRNRWDSLRLFTPAKYNALPGLSLPMPRNAYPTKDQMADYLAQFAAVMKLPVRTSTRAQLVTRAHTQRSQWRVETSAEVFEASAVVITTGGYQQPRIPDIASELDPGILQLHSSDYRNPSQLQPGSALVVGASNSGAEIALEVGMTRPTILTGRDPGHMPLKLESQFGHLAEATLWFMLSKVVTVNTPIGRKLRSQVRNHGLPVERISRADLAATGVERITERVVAAKNGLPVTASGSVLDVTNVIWCTGFSSDYSWIDDISCDDDGYPIQNHGVASNVEGLYFVGLRFQHFAASSLVGGAPRDARRVVDHIAARIGAAA